MGKLIIGLTVIFESLDGELIAREKKKVLSFERKNGWQMVEKGPYE